jgi:protein phosphatase
MRYDFFAITGCGEYRETNEDRVMVDGNLIRNGEISGQVDGHLLAVVCDGVGGSSFGEKAADIAAMSMRDACECKQDPFSLCSALFKADDDVRVGQDEDKRLAGMKTTIAVLYIDEDGYLAFNAGDTRVYQFSNGRITRLSVDHTLGNETAGRGDGSSDEALLESFSNTITRFLGARQTSLKFNVAGDMSPAARFGTFLLCSDGAYRVISDEEIEKILCYPMGPVEKGRLIYRLAKQGGAKDNISLALVEVSDDGNEGCD